MLLNYEGISINERRVDQINGIDKWEYEYRDAFLVGVELKRILSHQMEQLLVRFFQLFNDQFSALYIFVKKQLFLSVQNTARLLAAFKDGLQWGKKKT